MARGTNAAEMPRRRYSEEFKQEALALAGKVGAPETAAQLKLQTSQLYAWRTEAAVAARRSPVEQTPATENARIKRQLAEQEQEVAILKCRCVLREKPHVKYAFINQQMSEFSVVLMARMLNVSRSGFFAGRGSRQDRVHGRKSGRCSMCGSRPYSAPARRDMVHPESPLSRLRKGAGAMRKDRRIQPPQARSQGPWSQAIQGHHQLQSPLAGRGESA